ncbi:hypothetical protein B0I35DRAFT_461162 [Stachybotrys elegans]|uniref:Histidine kinase n=1 Tax=Stachybotrys elegans TaxID=80388 RepID=A0A8K0SPL3_9HYPO|nr:hypothetical protein B0I35DRAFT_461162 [Stachybotrys elegans]
MTVGDCRPGGSPPVLLDLVLAAHAVGKKPSAALAAKTSQKPASASCHSGFGFNLRRASQPASEPASEPAGKGPSERWGTSMPHQLREVGLVDLLDSDPRPAFIVACDFADHAGSVSEPAPESSSANNVTPSPIIHCNPALTSNDVLFDSVRALPKSEADSSFWAWIVTLPSSDRLQPRAQHSLPYLGVLWTRSVVLGKWIVMSGNEALPTSEPPRKIRLGSNKELAPGRTPVSETSSIPESESESTHPIIFHPDPEHGLLPPDFTPDPEPFLDFIQGVDWDANTLGPMDQWPKRLQEAFNQLIPDSRPIAVYWGPSSIAIYNEAFSKYINWRHPQLLGSSIVEYWPYMEERLNRVRGPPPYTQYARLEGETRFFNEKSDGNLEETYVKWSLTPILEDRKCIAVHHCLLDTTSVRLAERRMAIMLRMGESLVHARDIKSYWRIALEELERWTPSYDVPLAFIYSVGDDDESDSSRSRYNCPRICRLEGALGVPENHPIAPPILELRDTDEGMAPRFREAIKAPNPVILQTRDGTLPERLLEGLEWRGFGDPCQAAIICPIRPTNEENVMGILFLGLNPRLPYDNEYRQFVSLLGQKLSASLASTILLEEEARRGLTAAKQAAYNTAMLQKKLEYQTEQANRSVDNFKAVADFIPVGMLFLDVQGDVNFANDAWYRITGHPEGPIGSSALLECAIEEDRPRIAQAYHDIKDINRTDEVTFEFRVPAPHTKLESPYRGGAGAMVRHVLASAKAERGPDGSVIRMLTCLTDMTVQKNTAEEAVRRAQEAENLKRLAELATVGMYDMSMDGRLLSANNLFWELSGLTKVDLINTSVEPWQQCVVDEDMDVLRDSLEKLEITGRMQAAEIRLKTKWSAEDASGNIIEAPRWVSATFMPIKSSEGVTQTFMGCLSDVSHQKWQLDQERLRKEEAIESRRQQQNFIDMTSHEMRNPLSAMLHCTDAIIASLSRVQEIRAGAVPFDGETSNNQTPTQTVQGGIAEIKKLVEDSIENAETIVTCAQHQKRIVDDILTMSKLDSKLLAVTPCTVNPIEIVRDALKMFEVEARRVDIVLTSVVDKSYTDLGHEFLDLDPSRVKQVLINLLTNALKFTKTGTTRSVTLRVKGSRVPPGRSMTVVEFIPPFSDETGEYMQTWLIGRTNPVYILFEVEDTGQGLTPSEVGSLFNKFVQASAKTHVKYGGSGLGLFISRRLTELQNGAIGVASRPGVGSTFAFYIEAYIPSDEARREAESLAAAAAAATAQLAANTGVGSGRGLESATQRLVRRDGASALQRGRASQDQTHLDGILVVEDNLINQQITRRGLTERGYLVDVANHGIEALDKLQKAIGARIQAGDKEGGSGRERRRSISTAASPGTGVGSPGGGVMPINLVLMDIEMPVQDGLTCTKIIRELERGGQVFCASGGRMPIIAVTANARPEQVTEAKVAGCDDVLVKPYRIPELIERMQILVRRKEAMEASGPTA